MGIRYPFCSVFICPYIMIDFDRIFLYHKPCFPFCSVPVKTLKHRVPGMNLLIGEKKMKRIVLILSALLCALCLAAFASADSLTYTLLEDGSGYEITGCEDLYVTEVTIPAAHENLPVLSIAGGAFYRCDQLTAFRTEEGQPVFYAEDGVLFTDQPVKTLVCFPAAYARNAYQAPADLRAVAPWAFAGQHTLDFLHFREGVESFGDYMLAYAGRPMMQLWMWFRRIVTSIPACSLMPAVSAPPSCWELQI